MERRKEERLRYHWPVWFAEDFNGMLNQGQMIDVSSGGAAFGCYGEASCPETGREITARFSIPCYGPEESFEMANFIRRGRVCRVEEDNSCMRRIAIQFLEPLPIRPGEQAYTEQEKEEEQEEMLV